MIWGVAKTKWTPWKAAGCAVYLKGSYFWSRNVVSTEGVHFLMLFYPPFYVHVWKLHPRGENRPREGENKLKERREKMHSPIFSEHPVDLDKVGRLANLSYFMCFSNYQCVLWHVSCLTKKSRENIPIFGPKIELCTVQYYMKWIMHVYKGKKAHYPPFLRIA